MAQGKTGSSSPPGGPPKPGSQLDSMLGSLQSDLNKLGVATVAKGVCGACKKPIAGQVMKVAVEWVEGGGRGWGWGWGWGWELQRHREFCSSGEGAPQ